MRGFKIYYTDKTEQVINNIGHGHPIKTIKFKPDDILIGLTLGSAYGEEHMIGSVDFTILRKGQVVELDGFKSSIYHLESWPPLSELPDGKQEFPTNKKITMIETTKDKWDVLGCIKLTNKADNKS